MKIRQTSASLMVAAILLSVCALPMLGQTSVSNSIIIPQSSVAKSSDGGTWAHTNVILGSGPMTGVPQPAGEPPFPGYFYETPASIACIYGLVPPSAGCNPNVVTENPIRGSRAIAIVDAYDYTAAAADMAVFTSQFGVAPASNFQVVYAPFGGTTPGSCTGPATEPASAAGTGWDIEESLDIQYSHAMAPRATLYLVEAQSGYFTDLLCAVSVASNLVALAGGGEVSMSWGASEPASFSAQYPTQTSMDPVFTKHGVVYFVGAGDSPGPLWPSTSPNVVSVGGTTLSTNATTGAFLLEDTWQDAGGGPSIVEPRPTYQNGIAYLVGTHRGTPDVAAVANPYTGVWIYNSTYFGYGAWGIAGGTSLATPLIAGIVNAADSFSTSSYDELSKIYSDPIGFTDTRYGTCGIYIGNFATLGWDFCTGWGSPQGYSGK